MELRPVYPVPVSRAGRPPKAFQKWLTVQVEHKGRHIVLRDAAKAIKPFGRGFSKSVLSRKEHGELPTIPQLFALRQVFKVSSDELLERIAADYGIAVVSVPDSDPLPSPEAMQVAWAFDRGSETLKNLIRTALKLEDPHAHTQNQEPPEQTLDVPEAAAEARGRTRKSRGSR